MVSEQQCTAGLMTAGMAWRVKYRKKSKDGHALKQRLQVQYLGVHPKNRGGVYPAGIRCKNLCVDVLESGFLKEEVNHVGVCVEEVPLAEVRSRGADYEGGLCFNVRHTAQDKYLLTCFEAPYNDVRHMLLSHNHMLLILRAWLTNAKWDLPADEKKGFTYCDEKGRLSVAAVADSQNGKELAETLEEGIYMEILSFKMDVEEPTAASTISQALNKGSQMALRTTELTAVAVLEGECIVQMSRNVGQRVAFQTVRDRVREQLDTAADDPDLREVFEFLISTGVGTNTYIKDLLDFGSKFVDSKKRQLRFSAFASANAISEQAPWTKIAVIKRAYRKKPHNGYCPSPETTWGAFDWSHLESLEALLRFIHVTCKPALGRLEPQSRLTFLANFDVGAADAFLAAKAIKKNSKAKVQELLIQATEKLVQEIGLVGNAAQSSEHPWIDFRPPAVAARMQTAVGTSLPIAPTVIRFNEESGVQLNSQIEFTAPGVTPADNLAPTELPWQSWHKNNVSMGALEADRASAVAALHNLHESFDIDKCPIAIHCSNNLSDIRVVATRKVEAHSIWLPPCVPKQSKVFERSEHPAAVQVRVKVLRGAEEAADGNVLREAAFFVLPEFKPPVKKQSSNTAVAGTAVADPQTPPADEWLWGEGSLETMHPFWAVRRLTEKQLQQLKVHLQGKRIDQRPPRFNCDLQVKTLSVVTMASVAGNCFNRTRILEMPFMVNTGPLEEGEELIYEIKEKAKKAAPKRSWKDADKDQEREQENQKKRVKKDL